MSALLRRALAVGLRPLPFALALGWVLARAGRAPIDDAAANRSAAVCTAIAHEGLKCTAEDVVWVDGPSGVAGAMNGAARALVRAKDKEDSIDLYLAYARLSPEGQVLDLDGVHNVTHSTGADENKPVVNGALAAFVVEVDGHPEAVHVLDLGGHDQKAYEELSRGQRWQVRIADLQTTGQARGVKRTVYALVPAPNKVELAWNKNLLEVKSETRTIVIDGVHGNVVDGIAHVRVTPEVVAKPPTFAPWMSDRLRAVSWFGDEGNQVLKALVFTSLEWIKGKKAQLTGDTGEQDVKDDLGGIGTQGHHENFSDPDTGWPPKSLEPLVKPGIPGEGKWISLEKDPFITPIHGLPSPFVTTFVRGDPGAPHTRVYVTLWDPRLVALHMEAGTQEPVSSTGATGPGMIPRTPEVIGKIIAGFNGGFQATHGEYGMQANGVLYLPPKPYAATVMELRDGTTAFGAWPRSTDVPDEILSYRQNMTAMVQNDKYNPWQRPWWGGVPPGWKDAIHTTRSGICITKEGFVAYLAGHDIGPEPLGRAMLVTRCAFGIHLDMNPGLAGFEFYNVAPAAQFQPLGRPLQTDWEYEGVIKDMPEFKFRSRRMIRNMGHILFPRYVGRDARDFFYLTARSVLPGPAIDEASPWRTKGLPQHGYPYAAAIATTKQGDRKLRVLRLDPRMLRAEATETTEGLVAAFGKPLHRGGGAAPKHGKDAGAPQPREPADKKLFLGPHVFSIERKAPTAAVAIADVSTAIIPDARAAVGISDDDGMLQWVELAPEDAPSPAASEAMLKLLEKLGCSARGLVVSEVRAFLGGSMDIAGEPAAAQIVTARLVRTPGPTARPYFESTEIVPPSVWNPLQAQRVRWKPSLIVQPPPPEKPGEKPAGSSSAAPPTKPR